MKRFIPKQYGKKYNSLTRQRKELRKVYDIVLDPIEQIQMEPTAMDISEGNWASAFLQIDKDYITDNAKRKVVVFVHDTAAWLKHELLSDYVLNDLGQNFTDEQELTDRNGHSTHVTGIIAADHKGMPFGIANILAKAGLLKIIPYKVLTSKGAGQYSWTKNSLDAGIIEGKKWQENGYFVIHNFSLGGSKAFAPMEDSITEALIAGQLVVCAAGNTGGTPISFPARADGALAIAAITRTGERAGYSSHGEEMFMGAPGDKILSTIPGERIATYSGTSMASPAFCAVAAIMASLHPGAYSTDITSFCENYTTDIWPDNWDEYTGHGTPKMNGWRNEKPNTEDPEIPVNGGCLKTAYKFWKYASGN